jgi:hypothetical protein
MKKFVLIMLLFSFMPFVVHAKIEKSVDKFTGSYYYYDDYQTNNIFEGAHAGASFNIWPKAGQKNYVFRIFEENIFSVDTTVEFKIDGKIYTLTTDEKNTSLHVDGGFAQAVFKLSDEVYNALMQTNKEIIIRGSYRVIEDLYKKEFKLPVKYIKEVQKMFTDHQDQ